ncbi:MAG: GNAT family N-acetyltransferase [Rubrivivax sp.]|nr:GNAT family N-acetyltransferase [Rubrivivax sp.]
MSADAATENEQTPARFLGEHDRVWLSRIEDAGLNASAPPQQLWLDGWLVRTNPGKAQRARCINAVAPGRREVAAKLAECAALYRARGLPMIVRITPFTQPADLEPRLAAAGYRYHDDTRVMVLPALNAATLDAGRQLPGSALDEVAADDFAEAVGALRGSSADVRRAHAQRLRESPVPYRGFVLRRGGEVVACGQLAVEGDLVGLYDVVTAATQRRNGLGTWLCKRLLTLAAGEHSSRSAYLQVGADNEPARRIYAGLGFADGYSYHYRIAAH